MGMFGRKLDLIKKNIITVLFFFLILVLFINHRVNATTLNETKTDRAIVIKDSRIDGNITNNNHSSPVKEGNRKNLGKSLVNLAEKLNIMIIFPEKRNKKKINLN